MFSEEAKRSLRSLAEKELTHLKTFVEKHGEYEMENERRITAKAEQQFVAIRERFASEGIPGHVCFRMKNKSELENFLLDPDYDNNDYTFWKVEKIEPKITVTF